MRYSLSELTDNNEFWIDSFRFSNTSILIMSTFLSFLSTDWNLGVAAFMCNYFIAVSIHNLVNIASKYMGYWKVVISNNKVTLFRGTKTRVIETDSITTGNEYFNKHGDKVKVISLCENDTRLIIPILDPENRIGSLR